MNSKVYGRGDMYARKHATPSQEQRYQTVLSIAVYHTAQVLGLPQAPESEAPARERRQRLGSAGRRTVQVAMRPRAI